MQLNRHPETSKPGQPREFEYLDVKDTNRSSIHKLNGKNEKPIQVNYEQIQRLTCVLKIISTGQHLTLDVIRAMQNLKKAILTEKLREDTKREAEGKNLKDIELFRALAKDFRALGQVGKESSSGGFLAFWRSVDAAETIKKVTFKMCPPLFRFV